MGKCKDGCFCRRHDRDDVHIVSKDHKQKNASIGCGSYDIKTI
jgi:hypothetical protein